MKMIYVAGVVALILLLAVCAVSFAGCKKCVSTEYEDVEVIISDKYYKASWIQTISNGKTNTIIVHPAEYRIYVEYNSSEYTISGSDVYHKYKDRVGQTAVGVLKIQTYSDGTVKHHIISLE